MNEKKCRTILIDKNSVEGFFLLPFHEMRKILTKKGCMSENERIRATWTSRAGYVVEIVQWSRESQKNVKRMKGSKKFAPLLNRLKRAIPSYRNFSPQKEGGKIQSGRALECSKKCAAEGGANFAIKQLTGTIEGGSL